MTPPEPVEPAAGDVTDVATRLRTAPFEAVGRFADASNATLLVRLTDRDPRTLDGPGRRSRSRPRPRRPRPRRTSPSTSPCAASRRCGTSPTGPCTAARSRRTRSPPRSGGTWSRSRCGGGRAVRGRQPPTVRPPRPGPALLPPARAGRTGGGRPARRDGGVRRWSSTTPTARAATCCSNGPRGRPAGPRGGPGPAGRPRRQLQSTASCARSGGTSPANRCPARLRADVAASRTLSKPTSPPRLADLLSRRRDRGAGRPAAPGGRAGRSPNRRASAPSRGRSCDRDRCPAPWPARGGVARAVRGRRGTTPGC